MNFPLRDIKGLWLLLFCVLLTAVPSCKDDDDLLRKDFLIVSDSLTREPVSAINCRVEEGRDTLYVHANVPYEMFFQTSDEESDWLTYENKGFNAEAKADMIILSYKPMGEFYKRRSGTLSFTSSDKYLGAFVTVNQGFGTLLCEDFSWLNYGYDYPWDAEDERRIDKWTTTQKKLRMDLYRTRKHRISGIVRTHRLCEARRYEKRRRPDNSQRDEYHCRFACHAALPCRGFL